MSAATSISPRRSRRLLLAVAVAALLAPATAVAQNARVLGMGGVTVPGPGAADVNPAFAAVPGSGGSSLSLPLGALSAVTRDYWNPSGPNFDALSTLDQASRLDQYLLDPAVSPDQVTFKVDAAGLLVTFAGGSPLRLTDPTAYAGGIDLPIGGAIGPVRLDVRPFVHVHARFTPGPDLRQVFEKGSASASASLTADAEAGVALDVGAALPLPLPPALLAGARLYAGARASAVAGLAKGSVSVQGQARAEQDSSGHYTGTVLYSYDGTASLGGVMLGTVGYGGETALGLAATVPSGVGTVTAGVSVRHLGVMVWQLQQTRLQGDQSGSSTTALGTVQQVDLARHVELAADLALRLPQRELGVPGMSLLLAADGSVDLSGGFASHAGAEARFGPVALRAGLGYQDGLQLGVGAGVRSGPIGIDVAVSSHRSPFTDHQAYGVAASLGFGF